MRAPQLAVTTHPSVTRWYCEQLIVFERKHSKKRMNFGNATTNIYLRYTLPHFANSAAHQLPISTALANKSRLKIGQRDSIGPTIVADHDPVPGSSPKVEMPPPRFPSQAPEHQRPGPLSLAACINVHVLF
jgi:hypothetical protein